jgi:Anti-sigma-K factor rskA
MVVLPPLLALQTEGDTRRRAWWPALWGVLAVTSLAMALFAASFFRGRERDLAQELAAARGQLREQTLQLTMFTEAFAILSGPETAVVSFGQGRPRTPAGKVFVNPSQGILLVASDLRPAPPGKIYEMWLLLHGNMTLAAGLFQPAMDENALHVRRGPVDLRDATAVEVTLESAGGALQPTSQPVILARLNESEPRNASEPRP